MNRILITTCLSVASLFAAGTARATPADEMALFYNRHGSEFDRGARHYQQTYGEHRRDHDGSATGGPVGSPTQS